MSDHSNARPANMPNHHNARSKPTDFDLTVRQTTRRRLAEKTLYKCYRKNDQGKMVWMPYPQKDIDNINANLSTGPVEVEFGQNKFKIGLVQRGMSGKGRGCTRPVRMMEDGTFEVDLANRCVSPIAGYVTSDWRHYSPENNALIKGGLPKGPVEITIGANTFTVGLMQVGMTGTGKHYIRNVRMTTVNVPGLPSRTGPTDAVDNTERDQSTPSTMTSEPQLCDLKKQIKESQTVTLGAR